MMFLKKVVKSFFFNALLTWSCLHASLMLPAAFCHRRKHIYSYLRTSHACHADQEHRNIPFRLINQHIFGRCPPLFDRTATTLWVFVCAASVINDVIQQQLFVSSSPLSKCVTTCVKYVRCSSTVIVRDVTTGCPGSEQDQQYQIGFSTLWSCFPAHPGFQLWGHWPQLPIEWWSWLAELEESQNLDAAVCASGCHRLL